MRTGIWLKGFGHGATGGCGGGTQLDAALGNGLISRGKMVDRQAYVEATLCLFEQKCRTCSLSPSSLFLLTLPLFRHALTI